VAPEASAVPDSESTPDEPKPEPTSPSGPLPSLGPVGDEPKRDSEAEISAAETAALEAKVAREQELEQLIASGKYNVPINAVRRKRSRAYVLVLCLLALVLAAALVDIALDTGILSLDVNIPHTDFFSTTK
jgi:hypothetical protein